MTAPALLRVFAVFAAVGAAAGVPALVLCALRRVLRRRYSAAACCRLWSMLALVLLVLPVVLLGVRTVDAALPQGLLPVVILPESALPDANIRPAAVPEQSIPVPQTGGLPEELAAQTHAAQNALPEPPVSSAPQKTDAAQNASPAPASVELSAAAGRALCILAAVWLVGAVVSAVLTALHYIYWRIQCRRWSVPVDAAAAVTYGEVCAALALCRVPRLQCSGWVSTPLLAGVLRPVLLLPAEGCPQAHLRLIFTHELIHLQRRDVLRTLLLTAAGILHWYNPVVWLLAAAARRDAEQATDAAVLAREHAGFSGSAPALQHSAAYGEALLYSMARARRLPLATGFSAPKKELKERMKHLFDTRPGKRGYALLALLLCATLPAALLAGCAAGTLQVEEKSSASLTMTQTPAQELDGTLQTAVEEALEREAEKSLFGTEPQPILLEEIQLVWPVPESTGINKVFTGLYEHNGLDIAAENGSAIVAAADGTVLKARYDDSGYGTYIIVQHSPTLSTLYAHCEELAAVAGDTVTAGQLIARVGSSGKTDKDQCHFEVRIHNTQVDPEDYVELPATVQPLTGAQPGWLWPVPGYAYCSRGFTGTTAHDGLDICGAYDTPIYAAAAGTVLQAEETAVGDGIYVVLEHAKGESGETVTSKYAHCSALAVQPGDTVAAGDLIAYVGCTGNSTGNHCHLEIRVNDVPVDPTIYVGTPAK